jgi:transposase
VPFRGAGDQPVHPARPSRFLPHRCSDVSVLEGTTSLLVPLQLETEVARTGAVKAHAGKEINVVLDNLSTHDTPDVQAWLEANPNVTFHFTPVGSSWMNQIEIWFGIITRQAIRRSTFASVNHFIQRIRAYVEHWNASAEPFVCGPVSSSLGAV